MNDQERPKNIKVIETHQDGSTTTYDFHDDGFLSHGHGQNYHWIDSAKSPTEVCLSITTYGQVDMIITDPLEPTVVGTVHTSKDGSVWVLTAGTYPDERWMCIDGNGRVAIGEESDWAYISRR